jgi:hypothetical protein
MWMDERRTVENADNQGSDRKTTCMEIEPLPNGAPSTSMLDEPSTLALDDKLQAGQRSKPCTNITFGASETV